MDEDGGRWCGDRHRMLSSGENQRVPGKDDSIREPKLSAWRHRAIETIWKPCVGLIGHISFVREGANGTSNMAGFSVKSVAHSELILARCFCLKGVGSRLIGGWRKAIKKRQLPSPARQHEKTNKSSLICKLLHVPDHGKLDMFAYVWHGSQCSSRASRMVSHHNQQSRHVNMFDWATGDAKSFFTSKPWVCLTLLA